MFTFLQNIMFVTYNIIIYNPINFIASTTVGKYKILKRIKM